MRILLDLSLIGLSVILGARWASSEVTLKSFMWYAMDKGMSTPSREELLPYARLVIRHTVKSFLGM